MNINTLDTLTQLTNQRLDLAIDSLLDADLITFLATYLPDRLISLKDVTGRTVATKSITLIGTGDSAPFSGMQVTLIINTDSSLFLTAEGQTGWTFQQSFLALDDSVLTDLQFVTDSTTIAPPTLHLSSYNVSEEVDIGLSFKGTINPDASGSEILKNLSFLLGNNTNTISGPINIIGGLPDMMLLGPINEDNQPTLGPFTLANVEYELYSDTWYNLAFQEWDMNLYLGFGAEIAFAAQGEVYTIILDADLAEADNRIRFTAYLDEAIEASLAELKALIGYTDLALPNDDFSIPTDALQLANMELLVDPDSDSKLIYVVLDVEANVDWPLIPDLVTLNSIQVGFRLTDPLGSAALDGSVSGEFALTENAILDLTAVFADSYSFSGSLREDTTLSIQEVFAYFMSTSNDTLPDLSIAAFDFYTQLATYNYSGSLEVEGEWTIPLTNDSLALEGLSFSFDHSDGVTTFDAEGTFELAGSDLTMAVAYQGEDDSWQFNGEADDLDVADLSADIARLFDVPLPNDLLNLTLDTLQVGYNTGSQEFTLAINLSDWTLVDDWQITGLDLSVTHTPASGTDATLSGNLQIGDVSISVSATHDGTNDTWDFEGSYTGSISLDDLTSPFGLSLPSVLDGLTITALDVAFNTDSRDFSFTCHGSLSVNGKDITAAITIDINHQSDDNFNAFYSGQLSLAGKAFDLIFDTTSAGETFLADYYDADGTSVNISDLVNDLFSTEAISADLEFTLREALLAHYAPAPTNASGTTILGLDLGSGIDLSGLSNLPLIGQEFSSALSLKLAVQVLVASAALNKDEVTTLKALHPNGSLALPDALSSGAALAISLRVGDETWVLDLGLADAASGTDLPTTQNSAGAKVDVTSGDDATDDSTRWYNLQKAFGPVHFERAGLALDGSTLSLLLDVSIIAAGLTISLEGLSLSLSLSDLLNADFEPQFGLDGLGIDYSQDTLEIGGTFLKVSDTEFAGLAVLSTEQLSLNAIGAYGQASGHPSLFVYAVLDYPLGGPSFFFVEGLAGGFGYNRALAMPDIDAVADFPLVALATQSGGPGSLPTSQSDREDKLSNLITGLEDYLSNTVGDYFLAVGVKFTSFKIVDSFALLVAQFGTRFELDLLGLSTIVTPPEAPSTPVAVASLQLKATFLPDEGFLGVEGRLTDDSYILSKDCTLTGGFAFYSWFSDKHEGDFILTLGGYHADFNIPDHYPTVPRLGFDWQVDNHLSLSGQAYFALCSHALMAGGHLEALYQSGSLEAWFKEGVDFLISWKPFHYTADYYVDIGAKYTYHFFGTHHISVEVGADVAVWGPEFGGKATIHVWVVSVHMTFGADQPSTIPPIAWSEFKSSFLTSAVCSISVKDGLVRQLEDGDNNQRWIINPKELVLVTNAIIPSTKAQINTTPIFNTDAQEAGEHVLYCEDASCTSLQPFRLVQDAGTEILTVVVEHSDGPTQAITQPGIMPMGRKSSDGIITTHTITITRDGDDSVEVAFAYTPILKSVPTGLWGEPARSGEVSEPDLNGKRLVTNTLAGFALSPASQPTPGSTADLLRSALQFEPEAGSTYTWTDVSVDTLLSDAAAWDSAQTTIQDNTARASLLATLGLSEAIIDFGQAIREDVLIV